MLFSVSTNDSMFYCLYCVYVVHSKCNRKILINSLIFRYLLKATNERNKIIIFILLTNYNTRGLCDDSLTRITVMQFNNQPSVYILPSGLRVSDSNRGGGGSLTPSFYPSLLHVIIFKTNFINWTFVLSSMCNIFI